MCVLNKEEVQKLDLMFKGDSARDASSGIRGFLFQDYVTIMCLLENGVEYVCSEYLEDVDVFRKDGKFQFIQVKYYPGTSPRMNEITTDLYYQYLRLRILNSGLDAVPMLYIHREGTCRDLNIQKLTSDVQEIIGLGSSVPKTVTFDTSANEEIWLSNHVHIWTDKKKQKKALFQKKAAEDTLREFINLFEVTHLADIKYYQKIVIDKLTQCYENPGYKTDHWRTILLGLATTYVQRRYMPGANNNTLDALRMTRGEFDDYINQTVSTGLEMSIAHYLSGKVTETYGLITNHNELSALQAKMLDRIQWHTKDWINQLVQTDEGQYQLLNTLSKDEADTIAEFKDDTTDGKLRSIAECKEAFREFLKSIGMPQTMAELGGKEADIPYLAHTAAYGNDNGGTLGGFVVLNEQDMVNIYKLML